MPKTTEETKQRGFELTGEMASLEARQAAAYGFIKGWIRLNFKTGKPIKSIELKFLANRIKEQFNLYLAPLATETTKTEK